MTGNREGRTVIHEMVEKLIKEYQPKKIILFGSYAYGEVNRDSDIDLLIIKNTDKKPIDRWVEVKRLLRDTTRTFPVAPLVYTEKEVKERIALKDFFIEEILEKGETLYG